MPGGYPTIQGSRGGCWWAGSRHTRPQGRWRWAVGRAPRQERSTFWVLSPLQPWPPPPPKPFSPQNYLCSFNFIVGSVTESCYDVFRHHFETCAPPPLCKESWISHISLLHKYKNLLIGVQYFCLRQIVIHRPYAAGSRQLSRALAAMEGFLGNEAYRGNFVNKN